MLSFLAGSREARDQDADASASEEGAAGYGTFGKEKGKDGATQRSCVVCMAQPIRTASLPCRHSTMCQECMDHVKGTTGRCPLCRTPIDYVMEGDYDDDFVDFAPGVVEAAMASVEKARANIYIGMYDNVSKLCVIGLLCAAGSILSFYKDVRLLGVILAYVAFNVGYVPWFAVTVAAFEAERPSESGSASRRCPVSSEDIYRPHVLIAKLILLIVLAPLAVIFFFIPYGLYALFIRPLCRYVVPIFAYVVVKVIVAVAFFGYMYLIRPVCAAFYWIGWAIFWTFRSICSGVVVCACAFYQYVLCPIGQAISIAACHIAHASQVAGNALYEWVLCPLGVYVLEPVGRGLGYAIAAVVIGIAGFSDFVTNMVKLFFMGLLQVIVMFAEYVLIPILHGVVKGLSLLWAGLCIVAISIWHGICAASLAAYTYVLAPIGSAIAALSELLYVSVIAPVGHRISQGASLVWHGIVAAASWFAGCVVAAASFVYQWILAPVGKAIGAAAMWIAGGVAAIAASIYHNVLAPIGSAIAAVAVAVATVARDVLMAIVAACSGAAAWIKQLAKDVANSFG